ncbi:TPA_exp: hypothetical protein A8136_3816 [Trichophyton benhamiae CBS 112371]|nr:TPA_exp: hypothetical protein A8136_3816 [Trichophyton benhamiae CBS 112371]
MLGVQIVKRSGTTRKKLVRYDQGQNQLRNDFEGEKNHHSLKLAAHDYLLMVTDRGAGQNNDTLETLSGETAKEPYFAESVQK